MNHFGDRLVGVVEQKHSRLVVGLDPHWHLIPESFRQKRKGDIYTVIVDYMTGVVDATYPFAAAFKPQLAFFERFGPRGMEALQAVIQVVKKHDGIVIMDGKRNDIGSTAEAYASAYLQDSEFETPYPSDAITLNALLGSDSIHPFIQHQQHGVFVLVKTSNKHSGEFQDLMLSSGETLSDRLAKAVEAWTEPLRGASGYGTVGAVVGATYPRHMARLRKLMPHSWILVPGYGAQGGSLDAVRAAFNKDGLGALVSSSRAICFPHPDADFAEVRDAAKDACSEINRLCLPIKSQNLPRP
ncbi:MAG: orotidine-5'-phosphate decarboxylase [Acidobacteria bacterium]|nr:orotidine-5'-phosphate decarboxylase [Acidobacteriota bacterium]